MKKLEPIDCRMKKMDQSIHEIRVRCDNFGKPHLTKEYDNRKVQACYLSGDRYDEDWKKTKKEWLPYDGYKKGKEEKYRQQGHKFYQKEQSDPEKKNDFEAMLARFVATSERDI